MLERQYNYLTASAVALRPGTAKERTDAGNLTGSEKEKRTKSLLVDGTEKTKERKKVKLALRTCFPVEVRSLYYARDPWKFEDYMRSVPYR